MFRRTYKKWRRLQAWYDGRPTRPLEFITRYLYLFTLTDAGKAIVSVMVVVSPLAMYSLELPVCQLIVGLGVFLVVCRVVSLVLRPDISLGGALPERVTSGQRVSVPYVLTNPGNRVIRELGVGFFPVTLGYPKSKLQFRRPEDSPTNAQKRWRDAEGMIEIESAENLLESLAPGASGELRVDLRFTRRGMYELPRLKVYSEFPFNVLRTRARVHAREYRPETVLALPEFAVAEGIDIPVSSNYQPGGISLTSDIGESPEYIGSRLYRPGDNVRRLDFRAWARHGEPIVREFQEEYYCRVALIMDTHVEEYGSNENFEAAIQLSAAIADALSNGEYIVDLFAAGSELYVFRSGRHTAHFENILEILACLESSPDDTMEIIAPRLRNEIENISTALFVFTDWTESRERLVRMTLESGCKAKVYVVSDAPTSLSIDSLERQVPNAMFFRPEAVRNGEYGVL